MTKDNISLDPTRAWKIRRKIYRAKIWMWDTLVSLLGYRILDAQTMGLAKNASAFLGPECLDVSLRCRRGRFPREPGKLGRGWVELFEIDDEGRIISDAEGSPILNRHHGLVMWSVSLSYWVYPGLNGQEK